MTQRRSQQTTAAAITLLCLFVVLVWPAIFWGQSATSEAYDQREYHLPVIRTMAHQFPHVDLVNYRSATSPGYHLFMAVLNRLIRSPNELPLRLISSCFGLGFVFVVFGVLARRLDGWTALALTSPLLASSYILSGSIWLTTDNAAWMFVALALGGAAMRAITPGQAFRGGIYTTLAVLVRQIHIWVAAPVGMAALWRLRDPKSNRMQLALALATLIVPFAVLAVFVLLWHGLVPPGSAEVIKFHTQGMNPAVIPMTLALFGVFGVFFIPAFGPFDISALMRDRLMWLSAALALIASLACPTSYLMESGRWGGAIWMVVEKLPSIANRSIVFPPLAVLGAVILTFGWRRAAALGNASHASILVFALVCWMAAQSMNSQAWQRYCEPMVLITLAWLASLAHGAEAPASRAPDRRVWIGPAFLGICQLLLALKTLYLPLITGNTPS